MQGEWNLGTAIYFSTYKRHLNLVISIHLKALSMIIWDTFSLEILLFYFSWKVLITYRSFKDISDQL